MTKCYSIAAMDCHHVVITDSDLPGDNGVGALRAAGLNPAFATSPSSDDIVEQADGSSALIVQWAKINDELLARLPALRVISRLGIGYDMIDVDAATRRGIAVANTPAYCVDEVTTHTLALILSLSRGLISYDREVRSGVWQATQAKPRALRPAATTALVAGFGRIGSAVATRLNALGFQVLVYDPFVERSKIESHGLIAVGLNEGLARSEVVTLHVPLTADTHHMLNRETLALIPDGGLVFNTCRGGLIEERALIENLASGRLGGAGLDAFEGEPLTPEHPLLALPNVIVSPHAAWYSPESLADLPRQAAENVVQFLAGEKVTSIVNPDFVKFLRPKED